MALWRMHGADACMALTCMAAYAPHQVGTFNNKFEDTPAGAVTSVEIIIGSDSPIIGDILNKASTQQPA
jgi:hypothetical protein